MEIPDNTTSLEHVDNWRIESEEDRIQFEKDVGNLRKHRNIFLYLLIVLIGIDIVYCFYLKLFQSVDISTLFLTPLIVGVGYCYRDSINKYNFKVELRRNHVLILRKKDEPSNSSGNKRENDNSHDVPPSLPKSSDGDGGAKQIPLPPPDKKTGSDGRFYMRGE